MTARDYQDVIGGSLLLAIGALAALVAWLYYPLGNFSRMGPGMFPALVGIALAGFGLLVLVPALFRPGLPLSNPEYRSFFAVIVALLAFALTVDRFGFVPATVLLSAVSVLADRKLGIIGTVILVVALCAIAELIFHIGLGIPLDPFNWPFR